MEELSLALVDPLFPITGAHIYLDRECTLNQVDIAQNSNKFYVIQLLVKDSKYYLWTRYGRVGDKGITNYAEHSNSEAAERAFNTLYKKKSGNTWNTPFTPKKGCYVLMEKEKPKLVIKPSTTNTVVDTTTSTSTAAPIIILDTRITSILTVIGSEKLLASTMVSFNIDTKKMPLGKISKVQIEKAQGILKDIEQLLINNKDTLELSSTFWTLVPYATKRNKPPPVFMDAKEVHAAADMLETLIHIEVAGELIRKTNSIESLYLSMAVTITPLATDSKDWTIIQRFITNTHAPTHHYKLQVVEILQVLKPNLTTTTSTNHRILVHGSRASNFLGILTTGLRIPHRGQVSNGSVLGLGAYFADSISKSYNYCQTQGNEDGFVILCDVDLGEPHIVYGPNSSDLIHGKQSRIALGKSHPDPTSMEQLSGVPICVGNIIPNTAIAHSTFLYNEYVIYEPHQYEIRYLVQLRKV